MDEEIACPICGCGMELQKAMLMDQEVKAWVCPGCEEVIYDFSDKGESCRTCSSRSACLWR